VPEGRQLFADLTVDDNLRLGAFRVRERDPAWVYEVFPDLVRVKKQHAGSLSGGQQQMVAIGRALMSRPDVIAIDEMSLGLAPLVVRELGRQLSALNAQQGLGVLLVEQNARLALKLCTTAYVFETGRVVAHGSCQELARSGLIAGAYFGSAAEDVS
jgi:branched-chain amino acid transport system ATP-binding protein